MTVPPPRPSSRGAARAATALRAASAWAGARADGMKPLVRAGIDPSVRLQTSLAGVPVGSHDAMDAQSGRPVEHLQELLMIT